MIKSRRSLAAATESCRRSARMSMAGDQRVSASGIRLSTTDVCSMLPSVRRSFVEDHDVHVMSTILTARRSTEEESGRDPETNLDSVDGNLWQLKGLHRQQMGGSRDGSRGNSMKSTRLDSGFFDSQLAPAHERDRETSLDSADEMVTASQLKWLQGQMLSGSRDGSRGSSLKSTRLDSGFFAAPEDQRERSDESPPAERKNSKEVKFSSSSRPTSRRAGSDTAIGVGGSSQGRYRRSSGKPRHRHSVRCRSVAASWAVASTSPVHRTEARFPGSSRAATVSGGSNRQGAPQPKATAARCLSCSARARHASSTRVARCLTAPRRRAALHSAERASCNGSRVSSRATCSRRKARAWRSCGSCCSYWVVFTRIKVPWTTVFSLNSTRHVRTAARRATTSRSRRIRRSHFYHAN